MKRGGFISLMAAALLASAAAFPGLALAADPAFCSAQILVDYEAPLRGLPALRPPPKRNVHLGHAGLRLELGGGYSRLPGLVPGGGRLGYWIRNEHGARVDWRLELTLTRVDSRGKPKGKAEIRRGRLAKIPASKAVHGALEASTPGIYRLSFEIDDREGDRLGLFGSYFRVMPDQPQARLALASTTLHPGEELLARIENVGNESAFYGVDYRIDHQVNGVWERAPQSPQYFILPLLTTPPGATSKCDGFLLPPTTPPGRYRFVKQIDFSTGLLPREGTTLSAEFDVLP